MKPIALIMAGGSGERFWPLSRKEHPKQLLTLFSDKTMLEESIDRISLSIAKEDIFVITSSVLKDAIIEAIPSIPKENIIAEPSKRNTAPCLALGYSVILSRYTLPAEEIVIGVFTADHFISTANQFAEDVQDAMKHASIVPDIVTFGIKPSRPETGYGYIEAGIIISDDLGIRKVLSFREKPDLSSALTYISSGNYYWNSGMFFYRMDTFADAVQSAMPETYSAMISLAELLSDNPDGLLSKPAIDLFSTMEATSIDYGIMEKIDNVAVLCPSFTWDDVGSWDALSRLGSRNSEGNVCFGAVEAKATSNSILWNDNSSMILTSHSLDNMTIIVTNDAIMVCPTEKAQEVKTIVHSLRTLGREDLL